MNNIVENIMSLDWGYVLGTLIIRFVGVFVVLFILMVAMMVLGKAVSALVARQEKRKAEEDKKEHHPIKLAEEPEREADEEEVIAAIGAALAMSMESEPSSFATAAFGGASAGSWLLAGRAAQMDERMQGGTQRRR